MLRLKRVLSSLLGLSFALTACGGQNAALPPNGAGSNGVVDSTIAGSAPDKPLVSIPRPRGHLAYTDAGRRDAHALVRVSLTLRYNHQAELDRLVAALANPHAGASPQFLTREQFDERYAPTREQEDRVLRVLRRAGFTIAQRFPNRTIVDATARTSIAERFFSTEIHTVSQGKYGTRYTNVTPATVPGEIAPLVRDVSLNDLIAVQTVVDQRGAIPLPGVRPLDSSGQLVNGNFSSGSLSPGWIDESTTRGSDVQISTAQSYGSTYSAFMGTLSSPGINGWASIAQLVTIPAGGVLSFWVYQGIDQGQRGAGAFQAGYLLNAHGGILDTLYATRANSNGWVNYTVKLGAYAGQTDYLYFGSFGTGGTGAYVYQYLDDVAWVSATPSPSPTPTVAPTATPTVAPTATPTAKPTASPTPTPTPTVAPTATPTPSSGCNNASSDNGPLTNSYGTLATGVAKAFDFPVQHGCNGAGYTAAIAIDDPVNTTYLSKYLSAAQVTQTGTVTNEAVDGGGSGDDAETDLDVQTISGLAPGANIIVYDMGSLGDQQIEDTYNKVLTDGKATAVNSSFGGCEASNKSFADSTNSIAEQGASEGVEFSASSGDSGSNECGGSKGVSAPAGGPYFSSIGGIDFTESNSGVLESVTMGNVDGYAGGGGVSTVFSLPSYQSGIAGMITSGRNQPDISLPFYPVAVYTNGSWGEYLGTSWSSPASVALIIEANELHSTKLGWIDTSLYTLFSATGYTQYYTPCTSGNNGGYSCSATEYNQAAGIGAPQGWALANAL
ncbi:MAG TPA: protease pro-enzyme activation domain-containing protein [Candidatus Cybelea sp.]|nr:protease pro-enzyme activation domain-containing protein [Candidatus Cybelea sp.]